MKKYILLFGLALCIFLVSCTNGYKEESFFCMDTFCNIKVDTDSEDLLKDCRNLLEKLEIELSGYKDGGFTAAYNASEDGLAVPSDAKTLIDISEKITESTSGAFTVFSGGLTSLWEKSTELPSETEIKNALSGIVKAEFEGDRLKKPNEYTLLEFGGIAKGYACDKAVRLLKEGGALSGMVSFSSSIGVFGVNPDGEPWRIAIKDPEKTENVLGYVSLNEGFLSVSGDYERFYEINGKKYNHIINTKTGVPVDNGIHSVAVIAKTGAESDALSTAFFVMGVEAVEEKYAESEDVKYLIVSDDGIFTNKAMDAVFTSER